MAASSGVLGAAASGISFSSGGKLVLQTDGSEPAHNITGFGNTTNATIVADVPTGGPGINHSLGNLTISTSTTLNVQAGDNVLGGNPKITLGNVTNTSGYGGGTMTFNATSAALSLGGVTTTTGGTKTPVLDGTGTGNSVTGIISNWNATDLLAVTKSNFSTWTLSGANTYTGPTNVLGGTLRFAVTETLTSLTIADGATVVVSSDPPPPAPGIPAFRGVEETFEGADFHSAADGADAVSEPGCAALLVGGMPTLLGVRCRRVN